MQPIKGGAKHIFYRIAIRIDRNLRDQADSAARCNGHRSLIILQLPGQYLEQRGLSRSVFAQ